MVGKPDELVKKYELLLRNFGVEYYEENTEFIGTCPFCAGKFSMNKQTAQWRCFHCAKSGSQYNFIREIHPFWLEKTTSSQKEELLTLRKGAVDLEELETFELAYNAVTKEWMFPGRVEDGSLNNLYRWVEQTDYKTGDTFRQWMAAPSFNQMVLGLNRFRHSEHPVFIAEGHFDFLSFWGILRRTNQLFRSSLLGTPGTSFPTKHLMLLSGRPVITLFDNDPAGAEFTSRFAALLSRNIVSVKSLHHLAWPEGFKKGFDTSDILTDLPIGHRNKKA